MLLQAPPASSEQANYQAEQRKDSTLKELIAYLKKETLPDDPELAEKLVARSSQFVLVDGVLYFLDHSHKDCRRVVTPCHLREKIL